MTRIVSRYERPLLAYARSLLRGDFELARDVVQEVFLQLWQQPWPEIEGKVEGWLFLVCRRRCLDWLQRWEYRMHSTLPEDKWDAQSDHRAIKPEQPLYDDEQQTKLLQSIGELSAQQQQMLRLRLHQGLSYQQIADQTGSSVSSVGFQLHDAIKRLRMRLTEHSS